METIYLMSAMLLPFTVLAAQPSDEAARWWVYVGTYTGGSSEGIYVLEFDGATGMLSEPRLAARMENPSFLGVHPSLPVLYAAGEAGAEGGLASAFAIEAETGLLTPINRQSTIGDGPCHVAVSPSGKHLAVPNYGGGSVVVFPIDARGGLGEASAFVQHEGKGPDARRQEAPHAHGAYYDDAGKILFVVDLGTDKVLIYDHDDAGRLTPHDPPHASVEPGAGPRHLAFHPDGRFAYVVNEMGNTVTVFAYEADAATLRAIQTVTTLPGEFSGENSTAEIAVHPNGRYVYASNRGHDSIAIYDVEEGSGELKLVGHALTGGRTPRHFAIDPAGRFVLAANQGSDNIVVFAIDAEDGALRATGVEVSVDSPVCVVFVRRS